MPITFVTLGPEGTCHHRAVVNYARFQGLASDEVTVEFITDFFDGLDRIRGRDGAFLVQCSAHPGVHEVTERNYEEVFVVDTFIYPTKALAILSRRDLDGPARSLGIVEATEGYVDLSEWEVKVPQISKPYAAQALLRGEFDAALTHLEWLDRHPDQLKLDRLIGEVDTTWVVYGTTKRFAGEVIGIPSPELYREAAVPQVSGRL
jgi:hypothetical protein